MMKVQETNEKLKTKTKKTFKNKNLGEIPRKKEGREIKPLRKVG